MKKATPHLQLKMTLLEWDSQKQSLGYDWFPNHHPEKENSQTKTRNHST
jgi:hypothetical protein